MAVLTTTVAIFLQSDFVTESLRQTLLNRPVISNDRGGIFWKKIKSLLSPSPSAFFLVYLYFHPSIGSAKFM